MPKTSIIMHYFKSDFQGVWTHAFQINSNPSKILVLGKRGMLLQLKAPKQKHPHLNTVLSTLQTFLDIPKKIFDDIDFTLTQPTGPFLAKIWYQALCWKQRKTTLNIIAYCFSILGSKRNGRWISFLNHVLIKQRLFNVYNPKWSNGVIFGICIVILKSTTFAHFCNWPELQTRQSSHLQNRGTDFVIRAFWNF